MKPAFKTKGKTLVLLRPAPIELKATLQNLLTQYLAELASIVGETWERGEDGHIPYHWYDFYWPGEPERFPFGIWVDDNLAGLCLLRDTGTCWQIAEFFVLPEYRRQRVGSAAVSAVKEFCQHSGKHSYIEANTLLKNYNALAFWHEQGFQTIGENSEELNNVFYFEPSSNSTN